jgi:hypothetical protein
MKCTTCDHEMLSLVCGCLWCWHCDVGPTPLHRTRAACADYRRRRRRIVCILPPTPTPQ